MTALSAERLAKIRARIAAATPGPWEVGAYEPGDVPIWVGTVPLASCPDCYFRAGFERTDAELIAHAPTDLTDLLDEVDRLSAAERDARADRDSIRRRIERLHSEDWCIGGAWGDYGEAVIPLRALSTLDGPLAEADPKWETDPGFAATYGDCRATIEAQESQIAAMTGVVEAFVGRRDVLYPDRFRATPTDNYVAGFRAAQAALRAALAALDADGGQ